MLSLNSLNVSGLMVTFRRSRSPGALPLIPALMDSFRREKLKTKDRGKRTQVLVIGHPGEGKGGRGGRTRSYNGRYGQTPPERGTFSGLRYI